MRKLLFTMSVFLTVCLLFVAPATALGPDEAPAFTDVSGHWAEEAVYTWTARGVLAGYEDGSFRPDRPVTRGELARILSVAVGYWQTGEAAFSDLSPGDWFYDDVRKLAHAGILLGDQGQIRGRDTITREEAAVMLARAFYVEERAASRSPFLDHGKIQSWAVGFINGMQEKNYVQGADHYFSPQASLTRAEAVTLLDQLVSVYYNAAGTYEGRDSSAALGNVVLAREGISLHSMTIGGDLYLTQGLGEGDARLADITVRGTSFISGGGANTVEVLGQSALERTIINISEQAFRLRLGEDATIKQLQIRGSDSTVILEGSFPQVESEALAATLDISGAAIDTLRLNQGGTLKTGGDTKLVSLVCGGLTKVDDKHVIEKVEVLTGASGSVFEKQPALVLLAPQTQVWIEGKLYENLTDEMMPLNRGDAAAGGGGGGGGGGLTPPQGITTVVLRAAQTPAAKTYDGTAISWPEAMLLVDGKPLSQHALAYSDLEFTYQSDLYALSDVAPSDADTYQVFVKVKEGNKKYTSALTKLGTVTVNPNLTAFTEVRAGQQTLVESADARLITVSIPSVVSHVYDLPDGCRLGNTSGYGAVSVVEDLKGIILNDPLPIINEQGLLTYKVQATVKEQTALLRTSMHTQNYGPLTVELPVLSVIAFTESNIQAAIGDVEADNRKLFNGTSINDFFPEKVEAGLYRTEIEGVVMPPLLSNVSLTLNQSDLNSAGINGLAGKISATSGPLDATGATTLSIDISVNKNSFLGGVEIGTIFASVAQILLSDEDISANVTLKGISDPTASSTFQFTAGTSDTFKKYKNADLVAPTFDLVKMQYGDSSNAKAASLKFAFDPAKLTKGDIRVSGDKTIYQALGIDLSSFATSSDYESLRGVLLNIEAGTVLDGPLSEEFDIVIDKTNPTAVELTMTRKDKGYVFAMESFDGGTLSAFGIEVADHATAVVAYPGVDPVLFTQYQIKPYEFNSANGGLMTATVSLKYGAATLQEVTDHFYFEPNTDITETAILDALTSSSAFDSFFLFDPLEGGTLLTIRTPSAHYKEGAYIVLTIDTKPYADY